MIRLIKLKILVPLLVMMSCQKLKPEIVRVPEYPDFVELLTEQVKLLGEGQIEKRTILGDSHEARSLMMDSSKWVKELSFLKEINPSQPEYVGAFEKSTEGDTQVLTLKTSESGALKKVRYTKNDDNYSFIEGIFHEEKEIYVHHRDITINFKNGILDSYRIDGYQKMVMKDTVWFGLEGKVI